MIGKEQFKYGSARLEHAGRIGDDLHAFRNGEHAGRLELI
ncbi:hypothetical protein SDC9_207365 [bioreactor metagenome]|uniref:Uncharacterized protein n=1 Tax=bioreactor metagenome TaxID=1076179 RepID=A0A645JH15_9ZZZZ